jgi:exodeoxyribonuclease-3
LKIATWNVNSVNARLAHLLTWLEEERPDVVLLQELKCQTEAFPTTEIEDLGYNIAICGQKTYNGVAILSKMPLSDIITSFPNNPIPDEARYIEALVNLPGSAIRVASVYVPNGQSIFSEKYEIKLKFLESLEQYYHSLLKLEEVIIIGGDFNVALLDIDVYDPLALNDSICFSLKERQILRKFISIGLIDSYRMNNLMEEGFTWWDYRANSFNKNNGLRIDYIFCSLEAAQINTGCSVVKALRAKEKASDHAPVIAEFDINKE